MAPMFRTSFISLLKALDSEYISQSATTSFCQFSQLPLQYLGLPLRLSVKRILVWQPLIQKIKKKLSLWKGRVLSQAGHLSLIKSTLCTMPLYFLSIFKMPKGVTTIINRHFRDFFWSGGTHSKKILRVRWA